MPPVTQKPRIGLFALVCQDVCQGLQIEDVRGLTAAPVFRWHRCQFSSVGVAGLEPTASRSQSGRMG